MIQTAPGCIVCPHPDRPSERRHARTVPIVTESAAKDTRKQFASTGKRLCAHIRAVKARAPWWETSKRQGSSEKVAALSPPQREAARPSRENERLSRSGDLRGLS